MKKLSVLVYVRWLTVVMVLTLVGMYNTAAALEIKTGNPDLRIDWDNTVKYNYGVRLEDPDPKIVNGLNYDDGDRNFDDGTVTNRVDLFSELDVVYKNRYGVRVSGAFWYDQRYHDPLGNDSVATSNHVKNGVPVLGLTGDAEDLAAGPYGEVLDLFAFAGFNLGSVPLHVKVGRHTIDWGQALFSNATGISYHQFPIDYVKALMVPGSEVKELYRPLGNVSFQTQLTGKISLAGQYFFEWDSYRLPEAGTFLGPADIYGEGDGVMYLAPGFFIPRGKNIEPDDCGEWGVAMRFFPKSNMEIGLFYRRFANKSPEINILLDAAFNPTQYFFTYRDDIELYGVGLDMQILGVSVGAEVSYRKDMPLSTGGVMIMPGTPIPDKGETYGPVGDTWQGLINVTGLLKKTPLWDSATYIAEFTWSNYDKVTSGEAFFKGHDSYTAIDRVDRNAYAVALLFKPTLTQVLPGVDVSLPLTYSRGISGNSAIGAMNEDAGSRSAALEFDIFMKHTLKLAWVSNFGDIAADGTPNGLGALLDDRDMMTLTYKTTF